MELVCKCSVALSQTNRYKIISIEAADIYMQEQGNGVAVGIKMPGKNSDARFRMFRNFLDNSLDLIELEKAYKRICRKKFSFRDKFGNDYAFAVVNVKFNFIHRSENGKIVKIRQLREYFYENGFHIDGIHYVRYKRSAGSSREGKCLFIDERLYKAMAKWSKCGLKPKTNLASWESYKALSLSGIKGTVKIPLEGILFVPDYKSTFTDEVVSVEIQDGALTSAHKQTEITNDIWDGESLLDESVFRGNYADKHMLLLRNKFSQSCAFRTKLQKWFQDKNITLKELKSRRNNFLDQKIIRNRDEDTYLYVKGDFEPIISEEQWDRCRQIREQRVRRNKILTENGEKSHLTGVHTSDDVWTKKLRCRCGYRMRRNKWRKNRNGELIYGYKCYNQLNNGTKTTRQQAGVDDSGFCDLKEICDWKLEMMARRIFSGLWGNKKDILNKVSSLYQVGVFMEYREAETVKDRVTEQLAKLDEKLKKLTRMRLEDEITRESYFEFKSEIEKEKLDLLSKRRVPDAGMVPNGNPEDPAKKAEDFLLAKMDFTDHRIDRDVIGQFVGTIVPVTETCFNWYMNFDLADKSDDMKKLVWEFTIDYKEAKSYRKERDGMLRKNQWHDLTVRVFM